LIGLSQLVSNLRRRIQLELEKQRAWTSGMVTCHTGQGCPFWQLLLTLYVWVMWQFELAYMTMNEPKSVHLWPRYNLFHTDRFRFRVVCWQALHLWQAKRGPRENARVSGEAARDGGKGRLQRSLVNFHFCFAQTKQNTIGWKMTRRQLILIDVIPCWPAISSCRILWKHSAYGNLEYYDYSFLRRGKRELFPTVIGERFLRTVRLHFLPFSLDLNPRNI